MNYNKIKSVFDDIAKYCVATYQGYADTLAESAEMARLYNEVFSLSSRACAECVSDSAMQMANARTTKTIITYKAIMEEAIQMLARGDNQSDVVYHFDMMVAKEYGRI